LDLDIGLWIVLLIRFAVPLTIFRWPLWGAIASMSADTLDVVAWSLMPWGGYPDSYHMLDKYFDMYYLSIEAIVSQTRWDTGWPRRIALVLFVWRLTGFALFEATGERKLLFLCPNIFEYFFLSVLVATTFAKWYKLTPVRLAVWLTVLATVTWVREYFLHWQRVWDDVVAVDVIEEVAGAVMSWLGDWFGLILAVTLPLLAATLLLARAGHLGWLGRWASGQLHVRGYGREAD
jgi:hypothetical protein